MCFWELCEHKSPNFIDNKAIDKIVVSNKICPDKKDFKYFFDYKDVKKVGPFPYSFQKWMHLEEILIKLNVCIFS